ncbi:MAG: histidine phosphatase family protein [Firmicutes bacterium]|nr:histidine phosphatase family protein [Bacillota bacterium]
MATTRLIFIRHGETQWNRDLRIQGHQNILLGDLGRVQAKKLASRLAGEKLGAIYSSDLDRAYETAVSIAEQHGLPVTKLPALREGCFGQWEGLNSAEIQARFPEIQARYRQDNVNTRAPGGESCADLSARAVAAVREIAARHPGETVAVVSHGGTLKTILCDALGLPLEKRHRFSIGNASVSVVEYRDNGPVVISLNDTFHLEGAWFDDEDLNS